MIQKYPFTLRFFHWAMALIIIVAIVLGVLMARFLTDEPYTKDMFIWHKSFGVLAMIFIFFRMISRLILNKEVPPLSPTLPRYEVIGASIGHKLLYLLMIVVPLSGYLMSSTYPQSSGIFLFTIRLPDALPKNLELSQTFTGIHIVTAYILTALIVGHIAAVVKHRYFDKHEKDILKRMW